MLVALVPFHLGGVEVVECVDHSLRLVEADDVAELDGRRDVVLREVPPLRGLANAVTKDPLDPGFVPASVGQHIECFALREDQRAHVQKGPLARREVAQCNRHHASVLLLDAHEVLGEEAALRGGQARGLGDTAEEQLDRPLAIGLDELDLVAGVEPEELLLTAKGPLQAGGLEGLDDDGDVRVRGYASEQSCRLLLEGDRRRDVCLGEVALVVWLPQRAAQHPLLVWIRFVVLDDLNLVPGLQAQGPSCGEGPIDLGGVEFVEGHGNRCLHGVLPGPLERFPDIVLREISFPVRLSNRVPAGPLDASVVFRGQDPQLVPETERQGDTVLEGPVHA
mmetsp:Transcript_124628/g.399088  ORF Transcript_124628/g.399088 Transcript_124628/m.399088 type:complete len:336 (+) Transcript_124628:3414-4421(+)